MYVCMYVYMCAYMCVCVHTNMRPCRVVAHRYLWGECIFQSPSAQLSTVPFTAREHVPAIGQEDGEERATRRHYNGEVSVHSLERDDAR
jgi:hypothetical protein